MEKAFIDLVRKYADWRTLAQLEPEDERVLRVLLGSIEFEAQAFVFGKLPYEYFDDEGEDYSGMANPFISFHVVNNGKGDVEATLRLNEMICTVTIRIREGLLPDVIESQVHDGLVARAPFVPIRLNTLGDTLTDRGPRGQYPRFKDTQQIADDAVHQFCMGTFKRRGALPTYDALVCTGCHLRVLFPREVRTYGELRHALQP